MNTRPQMTIVEPRIRIPAWRSASPKNRKTRPEYTMPITLAEKRAMSPRLPSQSRGTANHPGISNNSRGCSASRPLPRGSAVNREGRSKASLDHADLGMGGQQRLGEHVVEREHPQEGDDDGLVDRSTHPLGASGRIHPFVTADDRDDRPEHRALEDRSPEVGDRGVVKEGGE